MQCYWPIAEPLVGIAKVDKTKLNQWQRLSWRNVRSNWNDNQTAQFRFDFEGMASNTMAYIDDAMLIDLTAAFGAGNEPTQSWCDTNIEYFAGNTTIQYEAPTVYDLTSTTPTKIKTGDILNCPYSGSAKSITLPEGQYKLECWGAQGGTGNPSANIGGYGGYSTGILALSSDTICYLYTGSGGYSKVESTVFNGGGKAEASSTYNSGSGGGASDIRIGQDSLHARVIVAGGGGGGAGANETTFIGGYGGGTSGGGAVTNSSGARNNTVTGGGTTSAGTSSNPGSYKGLNGSFGVGGSYSGAGSRSGGGGGGGWYGGAAGSYGNAGGGGSGYVYTSSTASNYPSGCLLNSSYYLTNAQTIAGNTAFTSPTGTSETGHTGNGYVRITVIKAGSGSTFIKIDSTTWKNQKNIFIKTPAILPSEYTQLEYIKCEGAQYINTGFIPTGNTRLILDFQLDRKDGQALFCGGRTAASGSDPVSYTAFFGNSAGTIRRDYYGTSKTTTKSWNAGDRIVFDANKNITTINGDSTLLSNFTLNTSSTSIMPIVLFTTCYQASSDSSITLSNSNWAYYKVFSCKIYDNDILARNFLPAENSSGTLGLYDTVNSTFYTNAGTGTFTAGPNVNPWKQIKGIWAKTAADIWS